jgi:hypothetical protein
VGNQFGSVMIPYETIESGELGIKQGGVGEKGGQKGGGRGKYHAASKLKAVISRQ